MNGLSKINNQYVFTKHTKLNGTLIIKEVDYDTAKYMVVNNHYSKKWNTPFGRINFGIFRDDELLGVAVYGNMMNPKSYASIADIEQNQIIELNRMWIDDKLGKNAETVLISASIKIIRNQYKDIKLVQSFADGRLGCGTIYKASNFKYFGYSKSLFFEYKKTGEVFHKVPMENTKNPNGFLNRNRLYLDNKLEAFLVKTYKYIYVLDKKVKIHLKEQPYPEYDKGIEIIKYTHGASLLVRLSMMYSLIGDAHYQDLTIKHIKDVHGLTNDQISDIMEKQEDNENYIRFRDDYIKNPAFKKDRLMVNHSQRKSHKQASLF